MLWEPKIITEHFSAMIKRYPNTNAYWCAGDQMALTVLEEHQKVSNKPLIISGFDWTP
jgi:ABC-type sugar transport system substrate-binding protein